VMQQRRCKMAVVGSNKIFTSAKEDM